jgi:hypothetical protein
MLAKQNTEFYIFLLVNQDVGEMQANPFVTISYQPDLLKAAKLVTDLLNISRMPNLPPQSLPCD